MAKEGKGIKKPAGFIAEKSGATSIEYAAIASLISVIIVGALPGIGTKVHDMFLSVTALF